MLKKTQGIALVSLALTLSQGVYADAQDNETVFNWAESNYGSFFSPGGQSTATADPWSYRYYPGTGVYLGINSADDVYVMGGSFGSSPSRVGSVSEFLAIINPTDQENQGNSDGNTTSAGSGACVNIDLPASGLTQVYAYSDSESGFSGSVTVQYELATDTRSRITTTSSLSSAGYSLSSVVTHVSEYRIENNYLYESRYVTETSTEGSFGSSTESETTTYSPEYLYGPVKQYCQGQSWTSASVQETTTTDGYTNSVYTSTESGIIASVNETVTVPAGTFDTVLITETESDGSSSKIWLSKLHGVFVKHESYDAEDGSTTVIEVQSLN